MALAWKEVAWVDEKETTAKAAERESREKERFIAEGEV